jgi:hypothetical protein
MSMYLLGVRHVLAPNIVYEFRTRNNNHGQWSALPPLERGLRQHEAARGFTPRGKSTSLRINASRIKQLAAVIEEYYWAIYSRHDRLSFALGAFWNSIFSSDPVQGYLSLTIVLEALLGTGNTEITHQISERVADAKGSNISCTRVFGIENFPCPVSAGSLNVLDTRLSLG